jgi:hypothetical protein
MKLPISLSRGPTKAVAVLLREDTKKRTEGERSCCRITVRQSRSTSVKETLMIFNGTLKTRNWCSDILIRSMDAGMVGESRADRWRTSAKESMILIIRAPCQLNSSITTNFSKLLSAIFSAAHLKLLLRSFPLSSVHSDSQDWFQFVEMKKVTAINFRFVARSRAERKQ